VNPRREDRAATVTVAGVQQADIVRRTLEIDSASEPLTGRLTDSEHGDRTFRGWLELFAAIDELRTCLEPADAPSR